MPRKKVVWRRIVFAALVVVSLALLTVFLSEPDSGRLHAVQRAGLEALSPLQSVASRAAEPFQDGYRWVKGLWSANSDRAELEAEVLRLQGELIKLKEAEEENTRLKGLLDFRDAEIFPDGTAYVVARVIGKSPTRWQAWVEIDKGRADGVLVDQAVVGATPSSDSSLSGKGLVGKVVAVTEHAAQIQLITDSQSSVAAQVQITGAEGIVEGTVSGKLIMDFVERDQPVEPKRVVVTSGFGGIYPEGIPIGLVESVGVQDVNIYKQIEIKSFVDFRVLEEVMVLVGASGAPLPDELQGTDMSPLLDLYDEAQ